MTFKYCRQMALLENILLHLLVCQDLQSTASGEQMVPGPFNFAWHYFVFTLYKPHQCSELVPLLTTIKTSFLLIVTLKSARALQGFLKEKPLPIMVNMVLNILRRLKEISRSVLV
jgi:hypothetical protein